jgi:parallel beta-helix repeat protein
MKTAIILIAVLFIPAFAFSDTIYVPDHYPKIQWAIDASVDGDTIIVRSGTYVGKINFVGKAITLMSEDGPDVTFIDGNQVDSVVRCQSNEGPDSVLDGFTITNGRDDYGAGMRNYYSKPTVTNCTFSGNTASGDPYNHSYGGGMSNYHSSPTVTECTFSGNSAASGDTYNASYGGGMYNYHSSPTVTECTFSGNTVSSVTYGGEGGGMYNRNSDLVVTNCIFIGNIANYGDGSHGGGMYNGGSSPKQSGCEGGGMSNVVSDSTVINCTFSGNTADYGKGAGMYNHSYSDVMVTNCNFKENTAEKGGGIYNRGSPTVTNCTFNKNTAVNGGGIYNTYASPTVTNCTFYENSAESGGGCIYSDAGSPTICGNIMINNSVSGFVGCGGGIYCGGLASPLIMNNWIMNNSASKNGGGIYIKKSPALLMNNTIYGNSADKGGGIQCVSASPTITNTILWNNNASTGPQINVLFGSPAITFCDVQGGWTGDGNIDADPLFVDDANGDFHLTFPSPCRDTGDNSAVTELTDFEGDPRIAWSGTVDMGADEFYTHLYCTNDFTPGGDIEGKLVGLPGTSPVGLFLGSGVLDPPLPTIWGNFHLQSPWLLLPLVPIPGNGVLVLPATIPATPPAPYDLPMQALIGLEPDSLTNLYVLEVR